MANQMNELSALQVELKALESETFEIQDYVEQTEEMAVAIAGSTSCTSCTSSCTSSSGTSCCG